VSDPIPLCAYCDHVKHERECGACGCTLFKVQPLETSQFAQNCSSCRMSRMSGDRAGKLECRASLPVSIGQPMPTKDGGIGLATFAWWPTVDPTNWCAKWEPTPSERQ
jgi:hypothetical protein